MKRNSIGLVLVVVMAIIMLVIPSAVFATNPTVAITVTAQVLAITNTEGT
jgi:Mg/Co/Ni transporter MgtE